MNGGKKRIYISGPITGVRDFKERFEEAARSLEAQGYEYINPAKLAEAIPGAAYCQYMALDMTMLGWADGVLFLPGARRSYGCRREYELAQKLGKEIIGEEEFTDAEPL